MSERARERTTPTYAGTRRSAFLTTCTTLALVAVTGGTAGIALTSSGTSGPGNRPPAAPTPPAATAPATTSAAPEAAYDAPVEVIDLGGPDRAAALAFPGAEPVMDIPAAALAAYQAAEQVMAEADPDCHVGWHLIAAIGRVLTDHGEPTGHRLADNGRVSPPLLGERLTDATGRPLPDSDAGELDGDRRRDRAVGPMLLDPTLWGVVGVDGDADGRRDPQDIGDAALSVGVLLCSGEEDLRDWAGKQDAVRRVGGDIQFVRSVLGVAGAYWADLQGYGTTLLGGTVPYDGTTVAGADGAGTAPAYQPPPPAPVDEVREIVGEEHVGWVPGGTWENDDLDGAGGPGPPGEKEPPPDEEAPPDEETPPSEETPPTDAETPPGEEDPDGDGTPSDGPTSSDGSTPGETATDGPSATDGATVGGGTAPPEQPSQEPPDGVCDEEDLAAIRQQGLTAEEDLAAVDPDCDPEDLATTRPAAVDPTAADPTAPG